MRKLISTGGVGDAFIAALKLNEWCMCNKGESFDWLHVESSDISKSFYQILELFPLMLAQSFKIEFEHDSNYIQNFLGGKWKDRESLPISFNRECVLHKTKWMIDEPFIAAGETLVKDKRYDVVIQVSAGQKNNKQWLFDINKLAQMLVRNYAYKVCLVGNDPKFKTEAFEVEPKLINEVCKFDSLKQALYPIFHAKLFIGLSGFLNYYACASKVSNVYLIEGADQEIDYFHSKWKDLTYGMKYASLNEVVWAINHFKGIGAL